jgi:hypothetical protein
MLEKLIHSLENEPNRWQRKSCGAAGESWTEWHGPEELIFSTTPPSRLSFSYTYQGLGAYMDGCFRWRIGFWDWWNPISKRSSRLRKAFRNMQQVIYAAEQAETLERYNIFINKNK